MFSAGFLFVAPPPPELLAGILFDLVLVPILFFSEGFLFVFGRFSLVLLR